MFADLNGHEKYTWRFITFLEKYHLMPWDWDKSYNKDLGLLPKLIRDLEARERIQGMVEMEQEGGGTTQTRKPFVNMPPDEKKIIAAADPKAFVPNKEILTNNEIPIRNKNDLASLMEAENSEFIQIVEEKREG